MYALCSYPPAMFHSSLLLREASSGFFLDLMFKLMSQVKTVDMSWTGGGGHSFNESHGLADLHTDASSTSTLSM